MEIRELITINLHPLTEPRQPIYVNINTNNTVTINIDIPKWLHGFYKQVELRTYDPISSKIFNINKRYLTFFPSNKHHICHFYYNDISIDCSDAYKDLWNINDNYSLSDINYHNTFISLLERSIENRLNKLKELYFKVESFKEYENETPYMYPPICEIHPKPEKPKCQISSEVYRGESKVSYNGLYEFMKHKEDNLIVTPGCSIVNDLKKLQRQTTKPESETCHMFTRDPDIDKLVEKITGVLEQITLRNDLSEETYKIKSIPRDIDKLISVYLNMSTEDRKNKKQELQKAIEAMLKVAVDYYEMVKCESVSELNVELKFIEHKYK